MMIGDSILNKRLYERGQPVPAFLQGIGKLGSFKEFQGMRCAAMIEGNRYHLSPIDCRHSQWFDLKKTLAQKKRHQVIHTALGEKIAFQYLFLTGVYMVYGDDDIPILINARRDLLWIYPMDILLIMKCGLANPLLNNSSFSPATTQSGNTKKKKIKNKGSRIHKLSHLCFFYLAGF